MKLIDLTGQRFGRWTVRAEAPDRDIGGNVHWICECDCGTERVVRGFQLRNGQAVGCGRGECHGNWKGGRHVSTGGYVRLCDPDHPNAQKSGYVLEHVAVMSEHLGRPLIKGESVHHKNGIKTDNRLENLELWASSHPSGQRVEDLVQFAREILALYEKA